MSFRCRQRLNIACSTPVITIDEQTLESGEIVKVSTDLGKEKMPDPKLFDINNQLKAGVDLDEVSSKVISHRRVSGKTLAQKLGLGEQPKDEPKDEV